jgi:hypothetical protein
VKARKVYNRELQLNKRIQYFHTYMLARAWFTAQVFPMPSTCERQMNSAILLFLWRGDIFTMPMSTLQRAKLKGWGLVDIGAKYRALPHHRLKKQSNIQGTLTAGWLESGKFRHPTPTHHRSNEYRRNWNTCATFR